MTQLTATPTLRPALYGLLSTATLVDDGTDVRWLDGVEYRATPLVDAGVSAFSCASPETVTPGDGMPTVTDRALRVTAAVDCLLVGNEPGEMDAYARAALSVGESPAVEEFIWDDGDRPLIGTGTTELAAAAVTVAEAVGLAEEWLYGVVGGAGMIHVPRRNVPVLAGKDQVKANGGSLLTVLGTPVAAGMYGKTGPDGTDAPDGQAWLAVTGPVTYRRSPVAVRGGFSPRTNKYLAVAERYYLMSWGGRSAAVLVDLEG